MLVQVLHPKRAVNGPSQRIIRYGKYNHNNNHKRLFEAVGYSHQTKHHSDLSSRRRWLVMPHCWGGLGEQRHPGPSRPSGKGCRAVLCHLKQPPRSWGQNKGTSVPTAPVPAAAGAACKERHLGLKALGVTFHLPITHKGGCQGTEALSDSFASLTLRSLFKHGGKE